MCVLSDCYYPPPVLSLADCKLFTCNILCGSCSSPSLLHLLYFYLLLCARIFFSFLAIYIYRYSLWKLILSKAVALLFTFLPALAPADFCWDSRLWPVFCTALFFLVAVDCWSMVALLVIWSKIDAPLVVEAWPIVLFFLPPNDFLLASLSIEPPVAFFRESCLLSSWSKFLVSTRYFYRRNLISLDLSFFLCAAA